MALALVVTKLFTITTYSNRTTTRHSCNRHFPGQPR